MYITYHLFVALGLEIKSNESPDGGFLTCILKVQSIMNKGKNNITSPIECLFLIVNDA